MRLRSLLFYCVSDVTALLVEFPSEAELYRLRKSLLYTALRNLWSCRLHHKAPRSLNTHTTFLTSNCHNNVIEQFAFDSLFLPKWHFCNNFAVWCCGKWKGPWSKVFWFKVTLPLFTAKRFYYPWWEEPMIQSTLDLCLSLKWHNHNQRGKCFPRTRCGNVQQNSKIGSTPMQL